MSSTDVSRFYRPLLTGLMKVFLLFICAAVLAVVVSLVYVDSLSFQHALIGMALLVVAQWGLARLVGFSTWHACILVAAGIVVFLIDKLTSGLLTISLTGADVGVPKWIVSALGSLNESTMETITIPIFLLLLLGIGYKWGWLGLVLLGMYDLIPKPISVVLDNGFSDVPPGSDSWTSLTLQHIQGAWQIVGYLVIGMCGYAIGRWWAKRKSRLEPAIDSTH